MTPRKKSEAGLSGEQYELLRSISRERRHFGLHGPAAEAIRATLRELENLAQDRDALAAALTHMLKGIHGGGLNCPGCITALQTLDQHAPGWRSQ